MGYILGVVLIWLFYMFFRGSKSNSSKEKIHNKSIAQVEAELKRLIDRNEFKEAALLIITKTIDLIEKGKINQANNFFLNNFRRDINIDAYIMENINLLIEKLDSFSNKEQKSILGLWEIMNSSLNKNNPIKTHFNGLSKRIIELLSSYETSQIAPSQTITFLGSEITALMIRTFKLNIEKKDEIILEITFSCILMYQLFYVFKDNHLGDLLTKDFQDDLMKSSISIYLAGNQTIPSDMRESIPKIFNEKYSRIALVLNTANQKEINPLQVAAFVTNQVYLIGINKHNLQYFISKYLDPFKISTIIRLKNVFNA